MNNIEKLFSASMKDIARGLSEQTDYFECLLCGEKTEKGRIYRRGEDYFDACRYMQLHIKEAHGSVFDYLIGLDKKYTGLSEHQNTLLRLFYQGKNDAEIRRELGIAGSSTIRNHRFVLKEKERQAKIFLVLMELLKAGGKKEAGFIPPHNSARMVDDRYNVTEDENAEIIRKYFPEGPEGRLKTFNVKQKNKIAILRHISKKFEESRTYSEKEINIILEQFYEDFATLRRYLIEYGFLDRKPDGSKYWLKSDGSMKEAEEMDRRKELIQQYKEMKPEAGIYQIRNTVNNKVLVVATPNLKTINGRKVELQSGISKNRLLQEELTKYGISAFVFEVLEVLKEKEEGYFDRKEELKRLEAKWIEKLQPFGDKGYHKPEDQK